MTDTWSRAVDLLTTEGEIGGAQLAFIRLTRPLGAVDGTLLLAVPTDFAKDLPETRARASLTQALSEAARSPLPHAGTLHPTPAAAPPPAPSAPPPTEAGAPPPPPP